MASYAHQTWRNGILVLTRVKISEKSLTFLFFFYLPQTSVCISSIKRYGRFLNFKILLIVWLTGSEPGLRKARIRKCIPLFLAHKWGVIVPGVSSEERGNWG